MSKWIVSLALLFTLCFSTVSLTSCAKSTTVQHPGAVNAFDSNAYDSLVTAQAAIESLKTSITPAYKDRFNKVVDSYNVAMASYKTYHVAATQKSSAAADTTGLQKQITDLIASISTLVVDVKGVKP